MKQPHIRKNKAINSKESCQYNVHVVSMKKILQEYFTYYQYQVAIIFIFKSLNNMSCFPCCSFTRASSWRSVKTPPWTEWPSTCPRSGGSGHPTSSSPSCPASVISKRGRINRRWKTFNQDLHR